MNLRDAFKIPIGEPTYVQLEEINRRLFFLKNSGSKSKNIGHAFIPSEINQSNHIYDYRIGREQCRYASQFLIDPKRELVFALLDYSVPNAFAFACGDFDAVLITKGFFVHLDEIIDRIFLVFLHGDMSSITGKENFKKDFINYCNEKGFDYSNELLHLTRHLAIGHVIGHEFGHLALGHCGYANSNNEQELEIESYTLVSNLTNPHSESLLSQAREIDADIHAARWIESLINYPISPSHPEVLIWLKADPCRLTFIFSLSSLIWYVNLGTQKFSTKTLLASKTHPPTSFRAKTIFDSALMQNVRKDSENKNRHERFAIEAFYLTGLGNALKRKADLQNRCDDNSKKELDRLNNLTKFNLIKNCLGEMGLATPNYMHRREIDRYLRKMWTISNADRQNTSRLARWKKDYIANWGVQ